MTRWKTTLLLAALAAAGCQVEKVEDGELPDVDVEGGKLPKYEVKPIDGPDLRVRMTRRPWSSPRSSAATTRPSVAEGLGFA